MEHTLQNVGFSALHEAETLWLHPGQPNWQLVRVKDYKLRLALAALLNGLDLYVQSDISLNVSEKADPENMMIPLLY